MQQQRRRRRALDRLACPALRLLEARMPVGVAERPLDRPAHGIPGQHVARRTHLRMAADIVSQFYRTHLPHRTREAAPGRRVGRGCGAGLINDRVATHFPLPGVRVQHPAPARTRPPLLPPSSRPLSGREKTFGAGMKGRWMPMFGPRIPPRRSKLAHRAGSCTWPWPALEPVTKHPFRGIGRSAKPQVHHAVASDLVCPTRAPAARERRALQARRYRF